MKDSIEFPREQRRAAGALHILTNHALPIHADVKAESVDEATEKVNVWIYNNLHTLLYILCTVYQLKIYKTKA